MNKKVGLFLQKNSFTMKKTEHDFLYVSWAFLSALFLVDKIALKNILAKVLVVISNLFLCFFSTKHKL